MAFPVIACHNPGKVTVKQDEGTGIQRFRVRLDDVEVGLWQLSWATESSKSSFGKGKQQQLPRKAAAFYLTGGGRLQYQKVSFCIRIGRFCRHGRWQSESLCHDFGRRSRSSAGIAGFEVVWHKPRLIVSRLFPLATPLNLTVLLEVGFHKSSLL